jgi:hypothetical protein
VSTPNASSPTRIALTTGITSSWSPMSIRSMSISTQVSKRTIKSVLDAIVAEDQVVRLAVAVPLLRRLPGLPPCGTRSATGLPLRVMTKLSPASTRRMISALSLRSCRWAMISAVHRS